MIRIYSKDNCQYCDMAIKLLSIKKIPFAIKKLNEDFTLEDIPLMESECGHPLRTFPIIFKGDEFIGGFDQLKSKLVNGELK